MNEKLEWKVFLNIAEQTLDQMEFARISFKDRIKKEWKESKQLPRKKKKAKRKSLLLDWSIANYNPFDYDYKDMKEILRSFK